jgi:hypothetical protein
MKELIEGKVAAIIDDFTIVINRGKRDGVEEGGYFVIFKLGEEIHDSETGESLGIFEIVKARVEVIHVQEKMSTCQYIQIEQVIHIGEEKVEIGDFVRSYEPYPYVIV